MGLQLATMWEKSDKLEMILDMPYYDYAFSALAVEINVDEDMEAVRKKLSILQMIINVLILKLHLGWEQTQINSL